MRPMLNGKGSGANFFNCSAVSYLWTDEDKHYNGSQGYFIEVYESYILIRGYDFGLEEWNSNSQFMIKMDTDIASKDQTKSKDKKDYTNPIVIALAIVLITIIVAVLIHLKKRRKG